MSTCIEIEPAPRSSMQRLVCQISLPRHSLDSPALIARLLLPHSRGPPAQTLLLLGTRARTRRSRSPQRHFIMTAASTTYILTCLFLTQ